MRLDPTLNKFAANAMCNRCVAAEPAHGELWTSISKVTENRRLDKASVLKKVVAAYFADGAVVIMPGGPATAG